MDDQFAPEREWLSHMEQVDEKEPEATYSDFDQPEYSDLRRRVGSGG